MLATWVMSLVISAASIAECSPNWTIIRARVPVVDSSPLAAAPLQHARWL